MNMQIQIKKETVYPQGCFYRDMKMSETNILKNKIMIDSDYIQKMEDALIRLGEKDRTRRETIGIISFRKAEMDCKKNLLKIIEDMPDCV